MSRAFARQGHPVVLSGFGPALASDGGLTLQLLRWPWQRLRLRMLLWHTRRQVVRHRPDLVFTRHALLARQARSLGVPVALELHSLPRPDSTASGVLRSLLNDPGIRRVVTISRGLADDLKAQYAVEAARVVVAHDGAEAGPKPRAAGAQAGALRAGYFGHLYPGKGMEMIAALAPAVPETRFEVYGGTEDDIARWRSQTAGLPNLTLHGHIPHAEVAARQAECDILLAPYAQQVSHSGGGDISRWMSPLKLFEYMAAGRPVVTSDMAVLREILTHGETAILCPPDDVGAWAAGLRRLAGDAPLRERLGAAGRDLLEREYTWDRRAERVLEGLGPDRSAATACRDSAP
nr:glycosyltransferase family 4 protein [Sagittula salina]